MQRKKLSILIIGILIGLGFVISPISTFFALPQETGLKRVIVISIDSSNSEYLSPEYMPYLYSMLLSRGAKFKAALGPVASETQGGHTVQLCGAWANTTGIIGNGMYLNNTTPPKEVFVADSPSYRFSETIFESIENKNSSLVTAFLSGKWRLRPLLANASDLEFSSMRNRAEIPAFSPIGPNFPVPDKYKSIVGMPVYMNPDGDVVDSWIINSLIEVVRYDDPDFIFVNLAWLDVAQHYHGAFNAMIRAKCLELDNLFRKLFTEFTMMGKMDSTLWVFTADHGQDEINKVVNIQQYLQLNGFPAAYVWGEGQSGFVYLNGGNKTAAYELLEAHPDVSVVLPRENMSQLHLDTVASRTGDIYISAREHTVFGKGILTFSNIGTHGGISCRDVPMGWMGPGIKSIGHEIVDHVPELVDIVATIGNITHWNIPANCSGTVLVDILANASKVWWGT